VGERAATPGTSATTVVVGSADAGTRAQVALTLGDDRYRVLEAADTEATLRLVAAHLPALLVLDATLPGPGALAVARSVRAQPETRDSRCVVLTRRGEGVTGAEGVDATLALPFTALALLRKVDGLLAAS
jgi:DNA-binding response OmpR family regulator